MQEHQDQQSENLPGTGSSLSSKRSVPEPPAKGLIFCRGQGSTANSVSEAAPKRFKLDLDDPANRTEEAKWIQSQLEDLPFANIKEVLDELVTEKHHPMFVASYRKEKFGELSKEDVWKISELHKEWTDYLGKLALLQANYPADLLGKLLVTPQTFSDAEELLKFHKEKADSVIFKLAREVSLDPFEYSENLVASQKLHSPPSPEKNTPPECNGKSSEKPTREALISYLAEEIATVPEAKRLVRDCFEKHATISTVYEAEKSGQEIILSQLPINDLTEEVWLQIKEQEDKHIIRVSFELSPAKAEEKLQLLLCYYSEETADESGKIRNDAMNLAWRTRLMKDAELHLRDTLDKAAENLKISRICKEFSRFIESKPDLSKVAAGIMSEGAAIVFVALDECGEVIESISAKIDEDAKLKAFLDAHKVQTIVVGLTHPDAKLMQAELKKITGEHVVLGIPLIGGTDLNAAAVSLGRFRQDVIGEITNFLPQGDFSELLKALKLNADNVNIGKLQQKLAQVITGMISETGVDLNKILAHRHLEGMLNYVPGITPEAARRIIEYAKTNGTIKTREKLLSKNVLDKVSFENAAGFIRVFGDNVLDQYKVHPQSYEQYKGKENEAPCYKDPREKPMELDESEVGKFIPAACEKMQDVKLVPKKYDHPRFSPISLLEAEKQLKDKQQGEYIFCNNDKGELALVIKMNPNSYARISVTEEAGSSENVARFYVESEPYASLEDISSGYIAPIVSYVKEAFKYRKFFPGETVEVIEDHLRKEQDKFPELISYCFAILPASPLKLLLTYHPTKDKSVQESIPITPRGYWFHSSFYTSIGTLVAWFKQHCMDHEYKHELEHGTKDPPKRTTLLQNKPKQEESKPMEENKAKPPEEKNSWNNAKSDDWSSGEKKDAGAASEKTDAWGGSDKVDAWGGNEKADTWGGGEKIDLGNGSSRGRRGRGDSGSFGGRRAIKCYNCGEEGHISRECPSEPRGRGGSRGFRGESRGRGDFRRDNEGSGSSGWANEGGWGASGDSKGSEEYKGFNTADEGSSRSTQDWGSESGGERRSSRGRGRFERGRGGPRDGAPRGRGCFNCGQEGHMARDCPNKDASGRGRDFRGGRGGRRGEWRGGERGGDRGGRRGRGNFDSGSSSGGWGGGWGDNKESTSSESNNNNTGWGAGPSTEGTPNTEKESAGGWGSEPEKPKEEASTNGGWD